MITCTTHDLPDLFLKRLSPTSPSDATCGIGGWGKKTSLDSFIGRKYDMDPSI